MILEFIKELSKEEIKDWKDIYKEDLNFSKSKKLTYAERQKLPDSDFALVLTVKKKRGKGTRKIRMFPIHDEDHVRNALARLGQKKVQATLKSLGVSIKKVMNKILKRAKKLGMKELLERHKSSVLTEEELIEKLNEYRSTIEELNKEKEQLNKEKTELEKKNENLEKEKEKLETEVKKEQEKANLYKEKGELIAKRRAELGDFAKELSDEDLLNDDKYELARLRKENYELRQKNGDLNTGHDSKDEITSVQKKVWELKKY